MKQEHLQNGALFLWILFAIVFCIGAIELKVETPAHPGPGFMPFLVGIFMGGISLITLLRDFLARSKTGAGRSATELFPLTKLRKPAVMCVAVFAYALILPRLGYLVSTFALMLVLFKGLASQRWGMAIIAAVLSVTLSYYIFVVWLGCQVPAFPKFWITLMQS